MGSMSAEMKGNVTPTTVVLLLLLICAPGLESEASTVVPTNITRPVPSGNGSTGASSNNATVAITDLLTTVITKRPTTTTVPVVTEPSNPNISQIDAPSIATFMKNNNGHRDRHLIGRYAYVWKWDETLVKSAAARIAVSCEIRIDNSDSIREILLTADDWLHINRDRKTLHRKMVQDIYLKGTSRIGCAKRINCDKTPDFQEAVVYFCHLAPSNYSEDAFFLKGASQCVYDKVYTSLCIDAPPKIQVASTAQPVKYIYIRYSMPSLRTFWNIMALIIWMVFERFG